MKTSKEIIAAARNVIWNWKESLPPLDYDPLDHVKDFPELPGDLTISLGILSDLLDDMSPFDGMTEAEFTELDPSIMMEIPARNSLFRIIGRRPEAERKAFSLNTVPEDSFLMIAWSDPTEPFRAFLVSPEFITDVDAWRSHIWEILAPAIARGGEG